MASCMTAKMSGGLDFQVNNVGRETAYLPSQYVYLCWNRQFCMYAFLFSITLQSWKIALKNFILAKSYRKIGIFTILKNITFTHQVFFPESYKVV